MACSHARYFTALAEEARPHLTRAEQLVWLPRLDREGDNLRAAQGWCLVQGQACDGEATELGLRLGWALWVYRHFRGQFREARAWLQQLLSLPTPTTRTAHRAAALAPAGFYSVIAGGDTTRAVALLEESLTLAREARRTEVAAIALAWLGAVVPDLARRQTLLEEGVTLGRTLGNSVELRFALIFLGLYHLGVGDHSLASDYFTQSRAAALAVGDRWTTSIACDGLAQVARARGDTETARRLFAEELALHRELEDKHGIGHTLRFLGELAEEQGDAEGAETCYAEALTMLRDAWDVDRLTAVLRGVAALALVREQPARALRLAGAVTTARAVFTVQSAADTAAGWEHIGEAARTRLSAVVAATAWDEGQAMSLEQAITYALQGAPQVADTP
jgi:tetratricopeptide (TPR) repeat protein